MENLNQGRTKKGFYNYNFLYWRAAICSIIEDIENYSSILEVEYDWRNWIAEY